MNLTCSKPVAGLRNRNVIVIINLKEQQQKRDKLLTKQKKLLPQYSVTFFQYECNSFSFDLVYIFLFKSSWFFGIRIGWNSNVNDKITKIK